ncbi:MAG: GNAT family N-acetyltransferase [Saprospiraceae bacterium]|nr:GNAT family N-acetyltransferase [Saprospiraceae bacterium]
MSTDCVVRPATISDMAEVLKLVRELAEYERAPAAVTATLETYQTCFRDGVFASLVAESAEGIVGTAIYYQTFSTWKGPMMYLEDFVVSEAYRGQGIGMQLFDAFITEARAAGAVMCKWQVLHWNAPAIRFYKRLPVVFDEEWIDVKYYF